MRWLVSTPQKLVAFLQVQLRGYSGKVLRRVLEANLCRINGRVERFGSRAVQPGDAVELSSNWKGVAVPKSFGVSRSLTLETLYEHSDFKIVLNPAGWVCSGPLLVHRLDKDTTGLLLIANNEGARDRLMDLFRKREVKKSYLALVDGIPREEGGLRKSELVKKGAFQGQTIWGSGKGGLVAITHWKRLATGKQAALLLCEPVTGRTHQIRVHLAEMGHPILVDRQYAHSFRCPLFFQRPLLHAYRLRFSYQREEIDVEAPLLVDIMEALQRVGIDVGHVRQLLSKGKEEKGRNEHQDDKHAEEVEKSSHFVH